MVKIQSVSLSNQHLLSFISQEMFLKSDGVKRNHENMMKSNDGIPSHHGSKNEIACFFGWFLKWRYSEKK